MRLIVTADLHYNHGRSRAPADEVIGQINRSGGDVLLLAGDAAVSDGDALERCLSRFDFAGEKLFVAGNHELWTRGEDSYAIFRESLPRRIRELGWRWLQDQPFVWRDGGLAIVGNIGWYDYSFAVAELGIPHRFYEHKMSPGAAARLGEFPALLQRGDDIPPHAMDVVARWNDGKFVKLHRPDEDFLAELLEQLRRQLDELRDLPRVIVAVHHVPFAQLLPPRHGAQWDFARAYLGSRRMGELLLRYQNICAVLCGHSHFPIEARIGNIDAVNIGSGYRAKRFRGIEL